MTEDSEIICKHEFKDQNIINHGGELIYTLESWVVINLFIQKGNLVVSLLTIYCTNSVFDSNK